MVTAHGYLAWVEHLYCTFYLLFSLNSKMGSCVPLCSAIPRTEAQEQILMSHGYQEDEWEEMANNALIEMLRSVSQTMTVSLSLGNHSLFKAWWF